MSGANHPVRRSIARESALEPRYAAGEPGGSPDLLIVIMLADQLSASLRVDSACGASGG